MRDRLEAIFRLLMNAINHKSSAVIVIDAADVGPIFNVIAVACGKPIDMVLPCPRCGVLHIDAPDLENGWTNPPHRSHLCGSCACVWRPADVPTNGVGFTMTQGDHDTIKWRTLTQAASISDPICLCPATSEFDPPCPAHGVRPIGQHGDGSYEPGEYDHG